MRVAKMLHAQLVEQAEAQGVSLNSLVQTMLAAGVTALVAGKAFGVIERAANYNNINDVWKRDSSPNAELRLAAK